MNPQEPVPGNEIDRYIATFPAEVAQKMLRIRSIIHSAAPAVQEKISWGMATFFIGKRSIHFAGHKKHIGVYPGPRPIEIFASELAPYVTSKGGIQFPYVKPLPEELIADIARSALSDE